MKISGIYAITNTVNGKCYVGSTVNRNARWKSHRTMLRAGKHFNRHLQGAWNTYGEAAFRFDWLEDVEPGRLFDVELAYIQANVGGYNLGSDPRAPWTGLKMSDEQRAAISERAKAAWVRLRADQEKIASYREMRRSIAREMWAKHRDRLMATRKRGYKRPPEVVEKYASKMRGRKAGPQAPETIAKRSATFKANPENAERLRAQSIVRWSRHAARNLSSVIASQQAKWKERMRQRKAAA